MAENEALDQEVELTAMIAEAESQPGVAESFEMHRKLAEIATIGEKVAAAVEPTSVSGANLDFSINRI